VTTLAGGETERQCDMRLGKNHAVLADPGRGKAIVAGVDHNLLDFLAGEISHDRTIRDVFKASTQTSDEHVHRVSRESYQDLSSVPPAR